MGKGSKPIYKHSTFVFECGVCGRVKSFSTEKEMRHAKIRHNKVVHNSETEDVPISRRRKSLEYRKNVIKNSEIIISD